MPRRIASARSTCASEFPADAARRNQTERQGELNGAGWRQAKPERAGPSQMEPDGGRPAGQRTKK